MTNPDDQRIVRAIPGAQAGVISAEKRATILAVLAERGKQTKGKPRARGDAPNPLGGRVFDMNCGWGMYRYQRRGRWCYTRGLYQNSEARYCDHNVVGGLPATRFVLAAVRQQVLTGDRREKLRARLRRLAAAERGPDPAAELRRETEAQLGRVTKQLETASRNLLLVEDAEQRGDMQKAYDGLRAERARLQTLLTQAPAPLADGDPEAEVEAALAGLDDLCEWATDPAADLSRVGDLLRRVDARLYLRFRKAVSGRRVTNVPAGGVLTFGTAPPPVSLYEGPVDRPVIRRMLAAGESVSPVLGSGSPRESKAGPGVGWSANDKRGTRRCT